MTLDPHDIELHDASLHSIATDHRARTVKIVLEYYRESDSRARVMAAIKFLGVVRMQEAADLDELADNARAGNVVQWVPSRGPGTTYLHLVRGFIAITAERVEFEEAAP
ncbi:hypothetical protein IEQ11_07810 [Lysobacter capsici]|uniref:hypothetical protein n=1 Tax=Lysobacter capsici TaxID=435897 RepID=UPI0017821C17|nr:hypothetical protein [Lysobacter capsici]UOF16543.1 hypothetical protein IEQ11_07810 [Lysobacter capsici]